MNINKLLDAAWFESLRETSGYGNHSVGIFLYSIAWGCKNIVEIGYHLGYSATMFCAGAVDYQPANIDLCVVSVDISPCDNGTVVKNQSFGHIHHFIQGNSSKVTNLVYNKLKGQKKIDLLFIDGDHSYEGCHADWLAYKDMVSDTGIVVFHDNYWEPIQRVIKSINGWNVVNINPISTTICSRSRVCDRCQTS